ncbi:MAG: hypothetical protein IJY09_05725 [Lachnospiraceae bacterium]|nr:hypothetical protein [Lachnospiraceae bacterium]
MKKRIAKLTALTGLLVMVAMGTIGCKKVECDICGEKARCSTEKVLGQEINICKDCEEDLEDIGNSISSLLK